MSDETDAVVAPERPVGRVVGLAIAIVFGLLFAYQLFQAISNAVALPQYYDLLGIPEAVPWWLLVVGIALPPLLYTGGYLVGRRMPAFGRVLVFLIALAASSALALSTITLPPLLLMY